MAAPIRPMVADRGSIFGLSVRHRQANGDPFDHEASAVSLVLLERSATDTVVSTHDGAGTDDGWISVAVSGEDTADWPAGHKSYRLIVDGEYMLIGPMTVRTAADV
jgi:hypothetical protein